MKPFRLRVKNKFSRISAAEETTSEAEKAKLNGEQKEQEEQLLEEQHTAEQEVQIEEEEEEENHIEAEEIRGAENESSVPEVTCPSATPTTARNAYRARGNGRRKKRNRS